jgi:hypothetical protein
MARLARCPQRQSELCASADHHEEAGPTRTETAGSFAMCQVDPMHGGLAVVTSPSTMSATGCRISTPSVGPQKAVTCHRSRDSSSTKCRP